MVASSPNSGPSERPLARADIAAAIAESYRLRLGKEIVPISGEASPGGIEQALMTSSSVILCHDGEPDPHFIFANNAAAAAWRMGVEQLVGMPSRLSAPPELRAERAQALAHAATDGVLIGYSGERVAADGSRFMIIDATVWTVDLPGGEFGQAVVFNTWRVLPDPEGPDHIR